MSKPKSSDFLKLFLLFSTLFIGYSIGLGQDARLIAKNTFPSVVMLEMRDDKNRLISLGSGFFVRSDVVATNYHVIESASDGFAKIVGQTAIYHIEGVVGIDKTKDLARLKLTGVIGKPLLLADISKIEVGQEVFALGNPEGLEGTISSGIISGSSLRQAEIENLIQITAPISPGSSGGPVVNRKGEVIGVAVASLKEGQNLNFAVPSSYLALLLANSTQTTSLSSITKLPTVKPSETLGPTLRETADWLTNKLIGRGGVIPKYADTTERNEDISFNKCTMNATFSYHQRILKLAYTYVINFKDVERVSFSESVELIFIFPVDYPPVRKDRIIDNKLYERTIVRDQPIVLWVGDKETGDRVIKAFYRVIELCKVTDNKEPF